MPSKKPRTSSRRHTIVPDDDLALMRLPAILDVFPVSRSEWWAGVRAKRYPAPIRLGKRMAAWRAREIRELLASV
jgi:prophage regulatory protein